MLKMSVMMVAKGPEPKAGSFLNLCKINGINIATTTEREMPKNKDNPRIIAREDTCHQKKEIIAKVPPKIKPSKPPILISLKKYFFKASLESIAIPRMIKVSVWVATASER